MARYGFALTRTASTTLSVGTIYAPASSMRRASLLSVELGSPATPADAAFQFDLTRHSTVGTIGAGVTPNPLDGADAACVTLAEQAPTVDPTLGAVLKSIPLNQRATYRWLAYDRQTAPVIPATANNGIAIRTPIATSLVTVFASCEIDE